MVTEWSTSRYTLTAGFRVPLLYRNNAKLQKRAKGVSQQFFWVCT